MVPFLSHWGLYWSMTLPARCATSPHEGRLIVRKTGGHKTRPYNWILIENT